MSALDAFKQLNNSFRTQHINITCINIDLEMVQSFFAVSLSIFIHEMKRLLTPMVYNFICLFFICILELPVEGQNPRGVPYEELHSSNYRGIGEEI